MLTLRSSSIVSFPKYREQLLSCFLCKIGYNTVNNTPHWCIIASNMTDVVIQNVKVDPKPLPQETREENAEIANSQADVTSDGGHRSPVWTPFLISEDDEVDRDPYRRR